MAITVYATRADLAAAINPAALVGVSTGAQDAALEDASRHIDGFLRSRGQLPLVAVGNDVRRQCTSLALWWVMVGRGFNPEHGDPIRLAFEDAEAWLRMVSAGKVTPDVIFTPTDGGDGRVGSRPSVISASQRGFSTRGQGLPPGHRWPFQSD